MKSLFKSLVLAPVAIATAASAAGATDLATLGKAREYANDSPTAAAQVTSISQLSDVKPTDWAFQALQSLVERYGCIVGYPNKTYQGNKALSRYEFAAGLNACIDKVTEYAASKEDLDTLKRLMEDFQGELATLRGRVDALEAKTKELQARQFSTTTKLAGRAEFVLNNVGNSQGGINRAQQGATQFAYRLDLNFNTSFTGKDLLKTTLRARNGVQTNEWLTSGDRSANIEQFGGADAGAGATNNGVYLDKLYYQFPVNNVTFTVGVNGMQPADWGMTNATFYTGNISQSKAFKYAGANIYADTRNGETAAIALNWAVSKNFNWQIGYINRNSSALAANNSGANGSVGGFFGTAANSTATNTFGYDFNTNFAFKTDSGNFRFNVAYALRNGTYGSDLGTTNALKPFGATSLVTSNNLAFSAGWAFDPAATFNATYGVGFASQWGTGNTAGIQTWSLGFTFPNLGAKGNSAMVAIGQQPYVSGNSIAANIDAPGLTFETNYKFQVTDSIAIQPGIIIESGNNGQAANGAVVANPGGTTYVPYIVTTFSF